MMTHKVTFPALIWLTLCANFAHAQTVDTVYTLTVLPHMTIRPLQGPRSVSHPNSNANVTFVNSSWLANTASATGSTVVFKTDTPFQVVSNPTLQRDVRLRVKRPFGTGGWVRNVTTNQSDYASGDLDAQVEVSSSGPGFAFIFVNVTFLTGDVNTLIGGDYELTLVGTITAN